MTTQAPATDKQIAAITEQLFRLGLNMTTEQAQAILPMVKYQNVDQLAVAGLTKAQASAILDRLSIDIHWRLAFDNMFNNDPAYLPIVDVAYVDAHESAIAPLLGYKD